MKTQTIINCVFAVAFVSYVVWQRNPTFDKITCKGWNVVDKDGKMRIIAGTRADGQAAVEWYDEERKLRITATTFADGDASVKWLDKDRKVRIGASTDAKGNATVALGDNDGKSRIAAATFLDGTVVLPTEDLNPPKNP